MRYLLSILLFISSYSFLYPKTIMQIELSGSTEGVIQIELLENVAPDHVQQIIKLVKEIARLGGDTKKFVPNSVYKRLKKIKK